MNMLGKTSPHFSTGSTRTQSGAIYTNGDLVITYAQPTAVTPNDPRSGYEVTVRATYHRDSDCPGDLQLPPARRERTDDLIGEVDGPQLMPRPVPAPAEAVAEPVGTRAVLVVFALTATVLFVAAGLAFDVGRFYGGKRFLQNAADAAASLRPTR